MIIQSNGCIVLPRIKLLYVCWMKTEYRLWEKTGMERAKEGSLKRLCPGFSFSLGCI